MTTKLELFLLSASLVSLSFGQQTPEREHFRTANKCFDTVWFSYSNPEVTKKSKLDLHYKNDHFQERMVTLSCTDLDLYVDISLLKRSLPQKEASGEYCKESAEIGYPVCSSKSPCRCCKVPESRCSQDVELTEANFDACFEKKQCNVTVTSAFLSECPGREYTCDGQKCHSRWVDVEYYCRPVEQLQVQRPNTSGIQLSWWAILLICLGCVLFIMIIVSCYKRCKADKLEYNLAKEHNNYAMKGNEEESDDESHEQGYGKNIDEHQTLPIRENYEDDNVSQCSSMRSYSSRRRLKHMSSPPPPPPIPATVPQTAPDIGLYSMEKNPEANELVGKGPLLSPGLSELHQRFREIQRDTASPTHDMPTTGKPAVPRKPHLTHALIP